MTPLYILRVVTGAAPHHLYVEPHACHDAPHPSRIISHLPVLGAGAIQHIILEELRSAKEDALGRPQAGALGRRASSGVAARACLAAGHALFVTASPRCRPTLGGELYYVGLQISHAMRFSSCASHRPLPCLPPGSVRPSTSRAGCLHAGLVCATA